MKVFYSCLPIKELGEASYYLACHITQYRDAETLKFDQLRYVQAVVELFGVTKTSAILCAAGGRSLSKADSPQNDAEAEEMWQVSYREVFGAFM